MNQVKAYAEATKRLVDAHKTFQKAVDGVLKYPAGPDRWREAYKLWLALSPANAHLSSEVATENRKFREANSIVGNKFGKSDDKVSSLREFMTFPTSLYYMIDKADPQAFRKKSNAVKMRQVFPQFCRSEVY